MWWTTLSKLLKTLDFKILIDEKYVLNGFALILVFLKYSGNKQGVRGARFCRFFGSSKNVPKSIGICPETLTSHFGIIKNHKSPLELFQKTKNKTIAQFVWHILGAIRPRFVFRPLPNKESLIPTHPTYYNMARQRFYITLPQELHTTPIQQLQLCHKPLLAHR